LNVVFVDLAALGNRFYCGNCLNGMFKIVKNKLVGNVLGEIRLHKRFGFLEQGRGGSQHKMEQLASKGTG
jgi:hypothetical protein